MELMQPNMPVAVTSQDIQANRFPTWIAPLSEIMQNGINPMTYPFNALGDGLTDDRAILQGIIDLISTTYPGATLLLPDGYTFSLGSMTDPINRVVLLLKPNVNIAGKGTLKIKNGFGVYENIFKQESAGSPLNNISIKNITIDGNFSNNPFSAQPTSILEARRPFFLSTGDNVTFDNVTLLNCTARHGFITNAVTNTTIKNCNLRNWGVSPVYSFDSSCIYTDANDVTLSGNYFEGTGICAATAMEIHGQRQRIMDNTIKDFVTGLILVADAVDSVDTLIKDNIFHNVCGGITFWASAFDVYAANLSGNDIYVDNSYQPSPYVDVYGIGCSGSTTKNLYNSIISKNMIRFNTAGNFKVRSGPYNAGIQMASFHNITNLEIEGNLIESAPNVGIALAVNDGTVTGKAKDISIRNNTLHNIGRAGFAAQSGIWFVGNDYYDGVEIDHNIIYDDRGVPLMAYGILISASATVSDNSPYGLKLANNRILGFVNQAVNAANVPFIQGENGNWIRAAGLSSGVRVGSTILDITKDVLYTQVTAPYGTSWRASKRLSLTASPVGGDTNWTLATGDELINISGTIGLASRWIYNAAWLACDQVGYRTNAGTPSGVLTPLYIGENVFDTTNSNWYRSTGALNTSWKVTT